MSITFRHICHPVCTPAVDFRTRAIYHGGLTPVRYHHLVGRFLVGPRCEPRREAEGAETHAHSHSVTMALVEPVATATTVTRVGSGARAVQQSCAIIFYLSCIYKMAPTQSLTPISCFHLAGHCTSR